MFDPRNNRWNGRDAGAAPDRGISALPLPFGGLAAARGGGSASPRPKTRAGPRHEPPPPCPRVHMGPTAAAPSLTPAPGGTPGPAASDAPGVSGGALLCSPPPLPSRDKPLLKEDLPSQKPGWVLLRLRWGPTPPRCTPGLGGCSKGSLPAHGPPCAHQGRVFWGRFSVNLVLRAGAEGPETPRGFPNAGQDPRSPSRLSLGTGQSVGLIIGVISASLAALSPPKGGGRILPPRGFSGWAQRCRSGAGSSGDPVPPRMRSAGGINGLANPPPRPHPLRPRWSRALPEQMRPEPHRGSYGRIGYGRD